MPLNPDIPHRGVTLLGVAGLFLFAFFARAATSVAYLALLMMLTAFVLSLPRIWPRLKQDPMCRLAAAFAVYLAARTAWAAWEMPELAGAQVKEAMKLVQLWLFLVVAWWLGGDLPRAGRITLVALAGFLVGVAHRFEVLDLTRLLTGDRTGLGMPAIALGLYCAAGILGLLLLAPRFFGPARPRIARIARAALWAVLLGLLFQGLIISQSRGSWLAAVLVIPPAVLLRARSDAPGRRRVMLAAALAAAAVCLVFLAANFSTLKGRLLGEQETLQAILSLDVERIPFTADSSIGTRFHLNRLGLEQWLQRPLFGWGPGTSIWLIQQQPIPALRAWVDLHNSYLEILVRLGLAGAAFFLAGAWLLARALGRARRQGRLPADWSLFLWGVFVLLAVWSLTDFRMTHADWRFFWWLFGGIAYTFALHPAAGKGDPD